MNERYDPIELLRAANPVDESQLPGAESPQAQRLLAHIISQPRMPTRSVTLRRVVAVAVAVAALAAAAWAIVQAVSDPLGLSCYQAPSLDSDRVGVAAVGDLDPSTCAPFWENGTLVNRDVTPPGQVPPLEACVSPSGGYAVFPSDDPALCDTLGLNPPDPASLPEADRIRNLTERIAAHFLDHDCQPLPEAEADIRRILDQEGLHDWTIHVGTPTPDRPCAAGSIDAATHTVLLIPFQGFGAKPAATADD